jgi:hypothetical protein
MGRAKKLKLIRKIASHIPPEKMGTVDVIATAGAAKRMGYDKEVSEGMMVKGVVVRKVNHYKIMKKMNYGQAAAYLQQKLPPQEKVSENLLPPENEFVENNISENQKIESNGN